MALQLLHASANAVEAGIELQRSLKTLQRVDVLVTLDHRLGHRGGRGEVVWVKFQRHSQIGNRVVELAATGQSDRSLRIRLGQRGRLIDQRGCRDPCLFELEISDSCAAQRAA